jgi:hypothetical protein
MSIQITEARDAKYTSSDHVNFVCEINHPEYGWIEYYMNIDDDDMTINNSDLISLLSGQIADYTPPTQEETAAYFRAERNLKLTDSDWMAGQDRTMTQAEINYRQELRDITTHTNWPNLNPEDWPVNPYDPS